MPTYVYETIPAKAGAEPRRFEVRQSMLEAPLTRDPETGEAVRRVISGGIEMPRAPTDPKRAPVHRHSDSCGCCNPRPKRA